MHDTALHAEVKPISGLSQVKQNEIEVVKQALTWLDPEFPELIPDVLEKSKCHWGTAYWLRYLFDAYRTAAFEHFKTHPLSPLPATDEFLKEWENMKVSCHRRYNDARERYKTDLFYASTIEYLRELWELANQETSKYLYNNKSDRLLWCRIKYTELIGEDLEELAEEIWRESEEYKAKVEAERRRREKREAEFEANMARWENNQRLRRVHDMEISVKGRLDIEALCHLAGDYHSEFFEQFFSREYCGWPVQYDPVWKGYWFPKEAGELSELLFSATGTLFRTNGDEKGEKIPEFNYVMIYGAFVCGYPLNSLDHLSPNDYRRAVHGFAAWLTREKGKREGTLFEYGTFAYWTALLEKVTIAIFGGRLDENDRCTLREAPRNLHRRIKDCWTRDELALFPELVYEKTFKEFLYACLEGGKHRERSLGYFKVTKGGRAKVEKFELVFNPECIPAPEPSEEERARWDDHCANLMSGSSFVFKAPGEPPLPPEEDDSGEDYFRDENAEAEAELEAVD
jgi:hypothetical protein